LENILGYLICLYSVSHMLKLNESSYACNYNLAYQYDVSIKKRLEICLGIKCLISTELCA
jgi:hypothetical protein